MNATDNHHTYIGLGLIIGVGLGAVIDSITGTFTGVITACGAGLGIVFGAIICTRIFSEKDKHHSQRKIFK